MRKLKYKIDTLFKLHTDWPIDWIVEEEFVDRCAQLWDVSIEELRRKTTFNEYLKMQIAVARNSPELSKLIFGVDNK